MNIVKIIQIWAYYNLVSSDNTKVRANSGGPVSLLVDDQPDQYPHCLPQITMYLDY